MTSLRFTYANYCVELKKDKNHLNDLINDFKLIIKNAPNIDTSERRDMVNELIQKYLNPVDESICAHVLLSHTLYSGKKFKFFIGDNSLRVISEEALINNGIPATVFTWN
eukprot:TRINITY_DN14365_c0_g1_i1.p1 TRINITY_DN14365_c0_g1~~TRINITY_DN14365_c0_g1_i1.p1  ORF type:complete len:110 (-),score=17.98 TRINITY_DN14365_c0_g1_i1:97-426(-)